MCSRYPKFMLNPIVVVLVSLRGCNCNSEMALMPKLGEKIKSCLMGVSIPLERLTLSTNSVVVWAVSVT